MWSKRLGYVAATLALSVVPLTGCDSTNDTLSTADACADLVERSLKELRDAQEQLDNPDALGDRLRDTAQDFKQKASEVDDAQLRAAVDDYAQKMRRLARSAESGNVPDLDDVVRANRELAEACTA